MQLNPFLPVDVLATPRAATQMQPQVHAGSRWRIAPFQHYIPQPAAPSEVFVPSDLPSALVAEDNVQFELATGGLAPGSAYSLAPDVPVARPNYFLAAPAVDHEYAMLEPVARQPQSITPARRRRIVMHDMLQGRLRVSQACEWCRERKTKCSGGRPMCDRCVSRGLPCGYDVDQTTSRVPVRSLRGAEARRNAMPARRNARQLLSDGQLQRPTGYEFVDVPVDMPWTDTGYAVSEAAPRPPYRIAMPNAVNVVQPHAAFLSTCTPPSVVSAESDAALPPSASLGQYGANAGLGLGMSDEPYWSRPSSSQSTSSGSECLSLGLSTLELSNRSAHGSAGSDASFEFLPPDSFLSLNYDSSSSSFVSAHSYSDSSAGSSTWSLLSAPSFAGVDTSFSHGLSLPELQGMLSSLDNDITNQAAGGVFLPSSPSRSDSGASWSSGPSFPPTDPSQVFSEIALDSEGDLGLLLPDVSEHFITAPLPMDGDVAVGPGAESASTSHSSPPLALPSAKSHCCFPSLGSPRAAGTSADAAAGTAGPDMDKRMADLFDLAIPAAAEAVEPSGSGVDIGYWADSSSEDLVSLGGTDSANGSMNAEPSAWSIAASGSRGSQLSEDSSCAGSNASAPWDADERARRTNGVLYTELFGDGDVGLAL